LLGWRQKGVSPWQKWSKELQQGIGRQKWSKELQQGIGRRGIEGSRLPGMGGAR
jgi:hypothetical protein